MSRSASSACAAAACAALLVAPAAPACSTCKCGDYTLTLLGSEKSFSDRLRFGTDFIVRSESAGAGLAKQDTDEWRVLLGAAYSFTQDLSIAVQVPWVHKTIETPTLAKQEAEGIGDIDVVGRYTLYRSGGGSGRHLAGLRLGVRLPTADEVKQDGEKLDIDVQPDAGATAPNAGAWYSYFRFPWYATVTATYFAFSDAHQDFEPGNVVTASALGQYGLTQRFALQLGVDAREARRNAFSGVDDPDSGGFLAMGFVGLAASAFEDLVLNVGVQFPVVDDLNGAQDEDAAFRAGFAYDFEF
ncbi:MAG TPA: hypothetical protein VJM11_01120 [Nevskiaceae bacterium]|nr:hypothetical protein [Nevskiaceae bacterium]